ncbi:Ectoine hydroxylase-related dioxygenase, phytanoyl-CoA dioxygenase (PhyH) family [Arboricoccus pini]|uniref:Ectoine hydroxylase-related dioxygenase, phytanoyl-CoA dioxygenase (PhyH) family n=1 Tax=Arboricoccus pini TaxID=1963835 RepID=A0A212RFF9_9PROT|nr:phytanoyl-CoA dioxygenase family protein [Arboricoccus pini]SNB71087.1 Ectoine hydroxylase-related dioxygenase, phytanoyl-CoA dioxygenase (PhyH) family [Arboricoccus pini]
MLSEAQIKAYREDGYIMVEDAVTGRLLDELRDLTYGMIEKSRMVSASDAAFDLDDGHSATSPRLTRIKQPHVLMPPFFEVLRSPKVRAVLEALIGPAVRLQTSKLNTKAPGGGAAVEWHQDWAFYPHTNDDLLAIGLMLEDVDEANGPLMVVPGTHKGPVLSHFRNGVFCGAIDPADQLFERDKAVTLTGKAGSMTLHHVRTLHGSAPNMSDRARLICFYEVASADAWPLAGASGAYVGMSQKETWEATQAKLIFGEQTNRPRLADVPVLLPLPPAPDSSSIFKTQKSAGAISAFAKPGERAA